MWRVVIRPHKQRAGVCCGAVGGESDETGTVAPPPFFQWLLVSPTLPTVMIRIGTRFQPATVAAWMMRGADNRPRGFGTTTQQHFGGRVESTGRGGIQRARKRSDIITGHLTGGMLLLLLLLLLPVHRASTFEICQGLFSSPRPLPRFGGGGGGVDMFWLRAGCLPTYVPGAAAR
jgi:hypothetical protein